MRKIAIVGAWPGGQAAPFDDPSWEIWTVGRMAGTIPRVTRLYEMHDASVSMQWQNDMEKTEAMIICWEDLPLAKWAETFGLVNNTIAIMLAHALEEGADEVGLFNAPNRDEYQMHRESVLYWFGILRGAGITVTDKCELVENWSVVYGGGNYEN